MTGDEQDSTYYRTDADTRLVAFYHRLYDLLPLVLGLLLVYLPLTLVWNVYHWGVDVLELLIVAYFALKILTGLLLYESKTTYLKKNWLDILLLLPFLAVFRAVGAAAQVLRGAYIIEALGLSGLVGESAVAARATHAVRAGRYTSYLAEVKYIQKGLHFVKDIKLAFKSNLPAMLKAKAGVFLAIFRRSPPDDD